MIATQRIGDAPCRIVAQGFSREPTGVPHGHCLPFCGGTVGIVGIRTDPRGLQPIGRQHGGQPRHRLDIVGGPRQYLQQRVELATLPAANHGQLTALRQLGQIHHRPHRLLLTRVIRQLGDVQVAGPEIGADHLHRIHQRLNHRPLGLAEPILRAHQRKRSHLRLQHVGNQVARVQCQPVHIAQTGQLVGDRVPPAGFRTNHIRLEALHHRVVDPTDPSLGSAHLAGFLAAQRLGIFLAQIRQRLHDVTHVRDSRQIMRIGNPGPGNTLQHIVRVHARHPAAHQRPLHHTNLGQRRQEHPTNGLQHLIAHRAVADPLGQRLFEVTHKRRTGTLCIPGL